MATKDTSVYLQHLDFAVGDVGGPVPNGYRVRASTEKLARMRDGTYLPKWRQVIQNGGNATTPMTASYRSIVEQQPQSLVVFYDRIPGEPHYGKGAGFCTARYMTDQWATWSAFTDNADARASNKFLNAVRKELVVVSGPTFLGELRETLRMIHKPAAGLQELINSYLTAATARFNALGRPKWAKPPNKPKGEKRGRNRFERANSLATWEKALAELWLEYSFGWKPLMMDIEDAMEAYCALFYKERLIPISEGGKDFYHGPFQTTSASFADVGALLWYGIQYHKELTSIVRYKGVVKAQAVTTAADRFARFGFTPSEFVPTAWELLPWSFLIDYFASIGDVLSGVVTDTASVSWCNKSVVHIGDLVCTDYPMPDFILAFTKSSYALSPGKLVKRSRDITRSVGTLPTPSLTVKWKQGVWRLTNMLALFQQVSSRGSTQIRTGRNYRL